MTKRSESDERRREIVGLWQQAVTAGALGRVTDAFTDLDAVMAAAVDDHDRAFGSFALSTRASLMRQAGRHDEAGTIDAEALKIIVDAVDDLGSAHADTDDVSAWVAADRWRYAAYMDAIVGLAADNLGSGGFDTAQAHLRWAQTFSSAVIGVAPGEDDLGHSDDRFCGDEPDRWWTGPRTFLRWFWVSCELDLYRGAPDAAAIHRNAATAWVARFPETTPRHRIKTALISAATDAAGGATEVARAKARACRRDARAAGLVPLEWAALSLAAGLDPDDASVRADLDRVHNDLLLTGMPFRT